jgi:hypothetical protein
MVSSWFNDTYIINIILSTLNEKEILNMFLINKTFFECAYKLYQKRKHDALKDANECITFYTNIEKSLSPDMLSTICFELLNSHSFFLTLNWNNFTNRLIEDIDNIVKQKNESNIKLNMIIPELVWNRNRIILYCKKHVDLYKYSTKDLRLMLKQTEHKNINKLKKQEMIFLLKSH